MEKTILFVDDEMQILRALKRLFYKSEYHILLANSGKEALELLDGEQVDMLITDMRMPVMDGHELLQIVRGKYPNIIRIALSGYTDKQVVLSALDKNLAKIYMFKPWDNEEMQNVIKNLFIFEAVLKDVRLLDIINNLKNLPTIPKLYNSISLMVENEEPISEIAKCIEGDPAIASRILRIANSAYFGSKTGDIKQAIMFIGLVNVKNIILTNSVYGNEYSNQKEIEETFQHSNFTNLILNDLYSKLLKKNLPNDSKSAGLLHNIGKGIMLMNFKELYTKEQNQIIDEIKKLGVSHQKIGCYILNWWELPLPIVESAMFHHSPGNKNIFNKELVAAVHIAQHYAWRFLKKEPQDELSIDAVKILGLNKDEIDTYIEDLFKKENKHE